MLFRACFTVITFAFICEITMELECFKVTTAATQMLPATQDRQWMDDPSAKHAYRCLPLTIANTAGWQFPCPVGFEAEWDGGPSMRDVDIALDDPDSYPFVSSHFGAGVITMHTGWLFRTPPGVNLLVQGAPNLIKDGIQALTGVVETDWLPFTFTMNWRFTRPGRIRFEKDEPFCFITLIRPNELDAVQPVERRLADYPALEAELKAWSTSRSDFQKRLHARERTAVQQGWQRHYTRGVTATGQPAPATHASKRRLKPMTQLPTAPAVPAAPPPNPFALCPATSLTLRPGCDRIAIPR